MTTGLGQSRIPELDQNALSSLQRELLQRIEAGRGRVPTPFKIWLQSPTLASPLHELGTLLSEGVSLSTREREIVILLIAREWGADYVFSNHLREAAEAGLPTAALDDIRKGTVPDLSDPREQSIATIVGNLVRKEPTNDAAFEDAIARLGHAGLAELLIVCGYFTSIGLAMKLYQMPVASVSR